MSTGLDLMRAMGKFGEKSNSVYAMISRKLYAEFKTSPCFVMPRNGLILDAEKSVIDTSIRLPYPKMYLEFESDIDPNITTKNLAEPMALRSFISGVFNAHIVFLEEKGDDIEIQIASRFEGSSNVAKGWNCWPFRMVVSQQVVDGSVQMNTYPTHQNAFDLNKDSGVDVSEFGSAILQPGFKALTELVEALTCSNVKAEKQANKKRLGGRRPGELPYNDYHELVVYTKSGKASVGSEGIGEGEGPKRREHLRRGHIRTYQSGLKVWVSSHVVNAGSAGKVDKHYKMKGASK